MRQRAELGNGVLQIAAQLVDDVDGLLRLVFDHVLGDAQLDRHGHQVLLRAVVQVAFQPAPLGIAGRHDAPSRLLQIHVGLLQLLQ